MTGAAAASWDKHAGGALSALAGLAPLAAGGVAGGLGSLVLYAVGLDPVADRELAATLSNAQVGLVFAVTAIVAVATGWVLQQAGSLRWGLAALVAAGLVDALGHVLPRLTYATEADTLPVWAVALLFGVHGARVAILAGCVAVGAWLAARKDRA